MLLRLNVKGKQLSSIPRPAKGTRTLEPSFSAFLLGYFFCFLTLNYSVLQYTIPLTSKFISFCVTLINPLGSHTLILIGYFNFNCGILTLLYCTLSTSVLLFSSFYFLFSLFSLLPTLFSPLSSPHSLLPTLF